MTCGLLRDQLLRGLFKRLLVVQRDLNDIKVGSGAVTALPWLRCPAPRELWPDDAAARQRQQLLAPPPNIPGNDNA